MGDFSKLSNFNPDANFKLVRIGADSPVLEVELNEMQDISEARYKNLIKSYFGNAIQGEGTYLYNNSTLTIQNESAFVDGNVIEITTLSLYLDEGEKAYLKVWEDTIKTGDLIRYKGNQQETRTVPNTLLDSRIGTETSRRIQVKYDLVNSMEQDTNTKATYLYLGKVEDDNFVVEANVISETSRVYVDKYVAKGSQKVFVTNNIYKMGANSMSIYVDGIYQVSGLHYDELTSNSFRLKEAPEQGVEVVAVYHKALHSQINSGHSSEHGTNGTDPLDILDLADRTGLINKIQERLVIKTVDCGNFNDMSTEEEEILDGGVF